MEPAGSSQIFVTIKPSSHPTNKPSRFNARSVDPDVSLVLYNSYTGHTCVFSRSEARLMVEADAGKIVIMRVPLVYCLESAYGGRAVRRIPVSSRSELKADYRVDVLNGVTVISGTGRLLNAPIWKDSLYPAARDLGRSEPVRITYDQQQERQGRCQKNT